MSDEKLKPVSPAMRKILELMGQTPQEFQAELTKPRERKLPAAPKLTPAAEIAQRWASERWRPEARVMFLRQATCTRCGTQEVSQHWPETFIRERLGQEETFRYLPARSVIASCLKLPRIVEFIPVRVHACRHCPEWSVLPHDQPETQPSCLADLLASHLASIESKPSSTEQTSSTSAEKPSLSESSSNASSPSSQAHDACSLISSPGISLAEANSLTRFSSPEPGSFSASFASSEPAIAEPTLSLTISDTAAALVTSLPVSLLPSE